MKGFANINYFKGVGILSRDVAISMAIKISNFEYIFSPRVTGGQGVEDNNAAASVLMHWRTYFGQMCCRISHIPSEDNCQGHLLARWRRIEANAEGVPERLHGGGLGSRRRELDSAVEKAYQGKSAEDDAGRPAR